MIGIQYVLSGCAEDEEMDVERKQKWSKDVIMRDVYRRCLKSLSFFLKVKTLEGF